MIINAKSGICPEDCGYCSQSIVSTAEIPKYSLLAREDGSSPARTRPGRARPATYCIVASGRGPSARELREVTAAVRRIKEELPMKICACLGLLTRRAGRASSRRPASIATTTTSTPPQTTTRRSRRTHTYDDRVATVGAVQAAGISPCAGFIAGMGETDEQLVEVAFALRDLDADSIPVNFLIPIAGDAARGPGRLDPRRCLKILAMLRLVCPAKEIRVAGGREVHLRSLQPLCALRRELDLRRRLPHHDRAGGRGRLGDARGPRVRDRAVRALRGKGLGWP